MEVVVTRTLRFAGMSQSEVRSLKGPGGYFCREKAGRDSNVLPARRRGPRLIFCFPNVSCPNSPGEMVENTNSRAFL